MTHVPHAAGSGNLGMRGPAGAEGTARQGPRIHRIPESQDSRKTDQKHYAIPCRRFHACSARPCCDPTTYPRHLADPHLQRIISSSMGKL
jgi:hypothetical protein